MRIVHIGPANLKLPALRGGAVERRMMELAQAQRSCLGDDPIVYSRGDATSQSRYKEIIIRYLKTGGNGLARRLQYPCRFARDVGQWNPQVVHVHNCAETALCLRAFGIQVPVVFSCDYHLEPLYRYRSVRPVTRRLYRQCLLSTDVIAPVSRYCWRTYSSYWKLRDTVFSVLPNGVDLERFRPDPAGRVFWRERLGLSNAAVVLYVGRICPQKGTDVLAEAYARVKQQAPQCALVAVGPADVFGQTATNPLVEELRSLGAICLPPVHDDELRGIYNLCDVFVMPTRELEMFGMAAVEAQACGKPVVASDSGGLRETVPPSGGRIFKAGDADGLAAQILALLTDPEMRRSLSEGARKNASQYGWEHVARTCRDLYTLATKRASSRRGAPEAIEAGVYDLY